MQRQVELWSILTPSPELEKEYRTVTTAIAVLVKKVLVLEEHLKRLRLARHHCQDGECKDLTALLAMADPTEGLVVEVPTAIMY